MAENRGVLDWFFGDCTILWFIILFLLLFYGCNFYGTGYRGDAVDIGPVEE